jgi:AcrR family transcriptional regulator
MNQEALKGRIISIAGEKFLSAGFSKVTMDEVAEELSVSKKTLYQHFRSKDALVEAVVEWHIMRVVTYVREITHSDAHFMEKLLAIWKMIGDLLARFSKQFQEDLRRLRPDLWKKVEDVRRQNILSNLSSIIDEGIRLGIVRGDIHKDVILLIYVSAIQGIINPEVLARHSFSAEEAFRSILDVLMDGILTDGAKQHFRTVLSGTP